MSRPLHTFSYQSNLDSELFPTSMTIDASGAFVAHLGGGASAAGQPIGRFEGQLSPEDLAELAAGLQDPAFVAEPVQASLVPGELFAKLDYTLGPTDHTHVGSKLLGETVAAGPKFAALERHLRSLVSRAHRSHATLVEVAEAKPPELTLRVRNVGTEPWSLASPGSWGEGSGTYAEWSALRADIALADLRQEHRVSRFLSAADLRHVADLSQEITLLPGETWQWTYHVPAPGVSGEYEHTVEHAFGLRTKSGDTIGVEVRAAQWRSRVQ